MFPRNPITPAARAAMRIERLPLLAGSPLPYAIAILLCVFAWWLRLELDGWFPPGYPFLTFFPAVILSAFLFGIGPGVLAAVLCGLLAWYWFVPPVRSFALEARAAVAMAFYSGVVAVDLVLVHWMQRANARLAAERERNRQLAEHGEIMFHELQHRVGNNLQMIGAILSLQGNSSQDPAVKAAIADASHRLTMIGRIQRQLYGDGAEPIMLDAFLREIVTDTLAAAVARHVTCDFAISSGLRLRPDAAIPLALIVTEAVSNAIEHGLPGKADATIRVALARADGMLRLEVADNGCGLPAGWSEGTPRGLGTRIQQALTGKLGATLEFADAGPGTVMRLSMPEAQLETVPA